jgi:hypothetical protein
MLEKRESRLEEVWLLDELDEEVLEEPCDDPVARPSLRKALRPALESLWVEAAPDAREYARLRSRRCACRSGVGGRLSGRRRSSPSSGRRKSSTSMELMSESCEEASELRRSRVLTGRRAMSASGVDIAACPGRHSPSSVALAGAGQGPTHSIFSSAASTCLRQAHTYPH